jgi:membrane-associated phospholipid phosphatase
MTLWYDSIGQYGPIILVVLSWILLWNHKNLFFYYTIGLFINSILNAILKGIIQEPRPMFHKENIHLLKTNVKSVFFQNGIPFDIFGMPSGHAQSSVYSTVFIYLALQQSKWLYFYIPLTMVTCFQRVQLNYHTITQIGVGVIVGAVFAYLMHILVLGKIKGTIRKKPDDNGPV